MPGFDSSYTGVIAQVPPSDSVSNSIYRVVHRGVLQPIDFLDAEKAQEHLDTLMFNWRRGSGPCPRLELRTRMGRTSGFQTKDHPLYTAWMITEQGELCICDDYGVLRTAQTTLKIYEKLLGWPIVGDHP